MRAAKFFAVRMMYVAWTVFAWAAVASCWTGVLRVRLLAWSGGGCSVIRRIDRRRRIGRIVA